MPDPTNIGFARRHLWKVLGLGAAAVVAKATMLNSARANDGDGDADDAVCFLKGAKIRTPEGERAIEDLAPGDLVATPDGPQAVKAMQHFRSSTMPVRIMRSAFATNIPDRELYLTPGHSIWTEGGYATAESLCNGRTITKTPIGSEQYFHLELSHPAVVYANGLPCESLGAANIRLCSRRSRIKSHLRSALSPWIDRRQPIDLVRDRLDARAEALAA
jgi:hypothetical protein